MLVSVKWLRDYVDINEDVKSFADKMTMTGTKMETIEYLGQEVEGVVVGKILEINDHPNAEKLVITKVDIGSEVLQIVTGAKNIKVGDIIPLATNGSSLPGGVKIKTGKLRGEASEGMMCSAKELGISEDVIEPYKKDGIYILDNLDEVKLGQDIKEVMGLNDAIIDFELTSNRPDCRCVVGIAREAAATLGEKIKYPEIEVKGDDSIETDVEVIIDNDELCKRYIARVVKDVKIEKSPMWMQKRLMESGVRPINNIVDITNFVMLELGQPMHAFNLDLIDTKKIVVRNAKEGEKFFTLDKQERDLDPEMLMITNGEKSLGVAGIMGGLNSLIKDDTTEILLESAIFKPENIRLTSKKLGLRSESSSRFEKGIDENLAITAMNRACQLIELLGAGKVAHNYNDAYPNPKEPQVIYVSPKKIIGMLGMDLPMDKFICILESLEFKCEEESDERMKITVPSFRLDIVEDADILEEIARMYGFDNIPAHTMKGNNTAGVKTENQKYIDILKNKATAIGLYEILTYSFVSPKSMDLLNVPEDCDLRDALKLLNPLGEDTSIMRRTILGNMMNVLVTNISKNNEEARFFELGSVFVPDAQLPKEKKVLTLGMYGPEIDFFDLKGAIEEIFDSVGFLDYEILPEKTNTTFHSGRCAKIVHKGVNIGVFGEAHPEVLKNYGLKKRVYIAEIDSEYVFENSDRTIIYTPVPKYPSITRDIALVIKNDVYSADIEKVIKDNGGELLESMSLFDIYTGEQIQEGYKSLAYNIVFRSMDKTLTDDDVEPAYNKIIKALDEKLDAKLRDK